MALSLGRDGYPSTVRRPTSPIVLFHDSHEVGLRIDSVFADPERGRHYYRRRSRFASYGRGTSLSVEARASGVSTLFRMLPA